MHEPGCNFSTHTMSLQTHLPHAVLLSTPKNVQQMSKWAEKHAGPREHVGVGCAALLGPIGHASGSPGSASCLDLASQQSIDDRTQERGGPCHWLECSQAQSITQIFGLYLTGT